MALTMPRFSRKTKIISAIVIVFVLLVSGSVSVFLLYRAFFKANLRFTLQQIEVKSPSGWWDGRGNEVMRRLKLRKGSTNLFELDLENMRKTLELEPGIERAVVARKLPDVLTVRIVERIPRAVLAHPRSNILLDDSAVVLRRDRCMKIGSGLPLIFGFQDTIPPFGEKFSELVPAMTLVMMTRTVFPSVRLLHIDASKRSSLTAKFLFGNGGQAVYTVCLPVRGVSENGTIEDIGIMRSGIDLGLRKLIAAMPQAMRPGEMRRTIETRYENTAILK